MTPTPDSPVGSVSLPPRPRLVFRAGFAGSRELQGAAADCLTRSLSQVLHVLGNELTAITPGIPVRAGLEPHVATFYANACPSLRLITGLCEGADDLAAAMLAKLHIPPEDGGDVRCLYTELAAVIPFDLETYRRSRPTPYQARFDALAGSCAYVQELDGRYEKPTPDTSNARNRRGRAYRAQSAVLLRHSDLLIAAANPTADGKTGGTLETVREAAFFELPVVFIHTGTGAVYLVEPRETLHSVLSGRAPTQESWEKKLRGWVNQIVADPDVAGDTGTLAESRRAEDDHGPRLLHEFFGAQEVPPVDTSTGRRKPTWREKVWERVYARFRTGQGLKDREQLEPYERWRRRATDLNYHYSGLYRGAFLLNYSLAIVAVVLATLSLMLLGAAGHTAAGEAVAKVAGVAGHETPSTTAPPTSPASTHPTASTNASSETQSKGPPEKKTETGAESHASPWLSSALLVLGVVKFGIVLFIDRNTHRANDEEWNDRAVDYRYLAERLRALIYLPRSGSFQPPMAAPPQFASRVVRQSAVDWLCDAITRSVSPSDLPFAVRRAFSTHDGRGKLEVVTLRPDPLAVVEKVRDVWIAGQASYHALNARSMRCVYRVAESLGAWMGKAVIGFVAVDIVLVVAEVRHWLPHAWEEPVRQATPWLIFFAAVLPAAVAALNGIRFQSECRRLAERSAVMRVMLAGRPDPKPAKPVGWLRARWNRLILILRHLFLRVKGDEDLPLTGGRWEEADRLAKRIASAPSDPDGDLGAWTADALLLTETVAEDFVQEVAEWSVLYAKELPEPG